MGKNLTNREIVRRLELWYEFIALCLMRNEDFANDSEKVYEIAKVGSLIELWEKLFKTTKEQLGSQETKWLNKAKSVISKWGAWPIVRGAPVHEYKQASVQLPISCSGLSLPKRFLSIGVDITKPNAELMKVFQDWLFSMRKIYEIPTIPIQSILKFEKGDGNPIDKEYLNKMFGIYDLHVQGTSNAHIVKNIWPEFFDSNNPKKRWDKKTYGSSKKKFVSKIKQKEAHVNRVVKFCNEHVNRIKEYLNPEFKQNKDAMLEIIKLPFFWPQNL